MKRVQLIHLVFLCLTPNVQLSSWTRLEAITKHFQIYGYHVKNIQPEIFWKNPLLKNFAKFTRKKLVSQLFLK